MRRRVIVDTGPLVAFINSREQFHDWVMREVATIEEPMFTCEPVITEACFLLRHVYGGVEAVISLVNRGLVKMAFSLSEEAVAIGELLKRYQSVPMSLADACLVRMSELYPQSALLTLDSDFLIYRQNRNQTIPVILPRQQ